MRRRRDLTGWILMAVLFIGAIALIFYILLMRAQHLAGLEERRLGPEDGAGIERMVAFSQPVVMVRPAGSAKPVAHVLIYEGTIAGDDQCGG